MKLVLTVQVPAICRGLFGLFLFGSGGMIWSEPAIPKGGESLEHRQRSGAAPVSLDFLAGDWTLLDISGKSVGHSHIEVQSPEAMIYERRNDADGDLPVWFLRMESEPGWIQLFPGPAGEMRAFKSLSESGEWPVVLGSDTVLRDGRPASFRLTLTRLPGNRTRRVLEMSLDQGRDWSTIFNYTYVRASKN